MAPWLFVNGERCDRDLGYWLQMRGLTGLAVLQRLFDEGAEDEGESRAIMELALEHLDDVFSDDAYCDPDPYDNSSWAVRNCDSLKGGLMEGPTWVRAPFSGCIYKEVLRLEEKLQAWLWFCFCYELTDDEIAEARSLKSVELQRRLFWSCS